MTEKLSGHYIYGEPYPNKLQETPVPFEIEWTLTDGMINGICIDGGDKKNFDTPSTINGFIENNMISFIKTYPKYWNIDEHGETRIFDEIPAPEIHYYGIFIDNHFEGTWKMTVAFVLENGEIGEYDYTGTWILYKVE